MCENLLLQKCVQSLCEITVFLCANLIDPNQAGENLADLSGAEEVAKVRYEVERLRLENASLVAKVEGMQRLVDGLCGEAADTVSREQEREVSKGEVGSGGVERDAEDDVEIRDLIRQAKQKLRVKYMGGKKSRKCFVFIFYGVGVLKILKTEHGGGGIYF